MERVQITFSVNGESGDIFHFRANSNFPEALIRTKPIVHFPPSLSPQPKKMMKMTMMKMMMMVTALK
jgi:hypothetical protein